MTKVTLSRRRMKATSAKLPDWSRRLPQPLVIPKVMALRTLDDIRKLMRHLPEDRREVSTWQHVPAEFGAKSHVSARG